METERAFLEAEERLIVAIREEYRECERDARRAERRLVLCLSLVLVVSCFALGGLLVLAVWGW